MLFLMVFSSKAIFYNIFINETFSKTYSGSGTLTSPYNNLFRGLLAINTNTTLISLLKTTDQLNFILLSPFYIIKPDDFIGVSPSPYKLFTKFNVDVYIMSKYCYDRYLNNITECQSNDNSSIEIQFKYEGFRIDIKRTITLINIRLTGRDLSYSYNASEDANCYLTRAGCCSDDSHYIIGTTKTKCLLENKIIYRNELTMSITALFWMNPNTCLNFINFEISYFVSTSSTSVSYTQIIYDFLFYQNITLTMRNVTFYRDYLKFGIISLTYNKVSSYYFSNISLIDYNYLNIQEKKDGLTISNYPQKSVFAIYSSFDLSTMVMINSTFINSNNAIRVMNMSLTLINCIFQNVTKYYNDGIIPVEGFILGFGSSSGTDEYDKTNMVLINITISNYYILTESSNTGLYFFSVTNAYFTNFMVSNVTLLRLTFNFDTNLLPNAVFRVRKNGFAFISNFTVNQLILNTSVFIIEDKCKINITHMVFTNLFAKGNGGLFFGGSNCTCSLSNSSFENFTILGYSNSLDLSGESKSFDGQGGMFFFMYYSYLKMEFVNVRNGALPTGEGLVAYSYMDLFMILSFCKFSNISSLYGGSIAKIKENATVQVTNCSFEGLDDTGFSHITYANIKISYSNFTNSNFRNTSLYGLIYLFEQSNLSIINSVFEDLYMNGAGGIVFCIHYNNINFTDLTFQNITVKKSYAILYGQGNDVVNIINCKHEKVFVGATFYYLSFQAKFFSYNNSFNNNIMYGMDNSFGGIFSIGSLSYINLSLLYFENNTIMSSLPGGVLYALNSTISLTNCAIKHFYSSSFGGIVFLSSYNTIIIDNITLENIQGDSGGLFYFDLINKVEITNIYAENVSALTDGGIIYSNEQNDINLNNAIFKNVKCQQLGGFLCGIKKNNFQIDKIQIFGLSAAEFSNISSGTGEGGFIYLSDLNNITIHNAYVSNALSERKGGCFSFFGGLNNFELSNATFNILEVSSGNGGFLSFTGNTGQNIVNISDIFVFQSFANNSGGFFSVENNFNQINLVNCFFYDSIAKFEFGGGLAIADNNVLVLFNCTFKNVTCNLQGGFLYSYLNNQINISYCNVIKAHSKASNGGLLNLEQSNNISIFQSNFSNMISAFDGGAFYFYNDNKVSIILCNLLSSSSENIGGLIASFKFNQIYINNTIITNVYTSLKGSLIYMYESNNFILNNTKLSNYIDNQQSSLVESSFGSNITMTFCSLDIYNIYSIISTQENSRVFFMKNIFSKNSTCTTVFNIYYSQIIIQNIHFDLNVSKYFIDIENSVIDVKSCKFFTRNASSESFFSILQSTISLKSCAFWKNSQNNYIMIYSENTNMTFHNNIVFGIKTKSSGAFISLKNSNLSSKNNFFLNNAALSGGVLAYYFDVESSGGMKIINSHFIHNIASNLGGSIAFEGSTNINQQKLLIKGSFFHSNVAFKGGAISVKNANNFTSYNNTFIKNKVLSNTQNLASRAKGGALYYYNDDINATNQKTLTNFINNSADIGGASYSEGIAVPNLLENQYIQNKATFYGKNDATDTKLISFYESNEQIFFVKLNNMNNIQSGKEYNNCLSTVAGIDLYSNIVYNTDEDYSSYIVINQTNLPDLDNRYSYTIQNGLLCFNGYFKRNQLPIESFFQYAILFKNNRNNSLILNMKFRNCVVGERLTDDRTCDPCPINTYSFVTDFSQGTTPKCHTCDESTNFYCFGKNFLTSKKGYWRLNENSTNFIKCRNSACLGDPRKPSLTNIINNNTIYDSRYATSLCEEGYTGIFCNECEDNYGHIDDNNCLKCGSATYNFNLFFQLIFRILFMVYSVYQEYIMVCSISSADINNNEVTTTNILKIFANHMQVLSIIRSFPFEWPNEFSLTANLFLSFTPNMSEGLSLECMLKGGYFNINSQYFKLIICFVYPFIIAFLALILIKIVQSIKKDKMKFLMARKSTIERKKTSLSPLRKSTNLNLRNSSISCENLEKYIKYSWVLISIFLCILILCFPDIIKVILSMFACENFGDSTITEYRLISDQTIRCNSESHKLWTYFFAIPFLILMGVCFPSYVIINMAWAYYKKKIENRDREILFKYGFFYCAYKQKFFYWDLVILIRKLMLLFISLFYMTVVDVNKDLTPILLVFLILVISVLLQYHFCPFDESKFEIVNRVESVSLSTLVLTALMTIFYFGETAIGQSIEYRVVGFLIIVTVVVNIFFLGYFLKAFYIHNIKPKIKMAKEKSELLFSKLKNIRTSIKNSIMWTSFARKFSSKNTSPDHSPEIKNKAKLKTISIFKCNYDSSLKKELFSPLKKISKEEKREQKKTLFVLGEIVLKQGKEDLERYNLLILEQERLKEKLSQLNNEKKVIEIDLGDEIPEEKEGALLSTISFVHKIYNNRYYYNLACLNENNLLVSNAIYDVKSKTKLKHQKFEDYYLKISIEINLKQEADEFTHEIKNGEGLKYFLFLFLLNLYIIRIWYLNIGTQSTKKRRKSFIKDIKNLFEINMHTHQFS